MNSISRLNLYAQSISSSLFNKQTCKSAAVITGLAISIISSSIFAHLDLTHFRILQVSACFISFCALPKILRCQNEKMIKSALVVMFAVNGCLGMGNTLLTISKLGKLIVENFISLEPSGALLYTSVLSGYLFLTNLFIRGELNFLSYVYNILTEDNWNDRIHAIKKYFGRKKTSLNLIHFICLINPSMITAKCYNSNQRPAESVVELFNMCVPGKLNFLKFREYIQNACETGAVYQEDGDADLFLENSYSSINHTLLLLRKKDLKLAIDLLITKGSNLVPNVLSKENYSNLFLHPLVLKIIDSSVLNYVAQLGKLSDLKNQFDALNEKSILLQNKILDSDRLALEDVDILSHQYAELISELNKMTHATGEIIESRTKWKQFLDFLKENEMPFPGNEEEVIQSCLIENNKEGDDLYSMHLSLTGTGDKNKIDINIRDRLDWIGNKLHGKKEEFEINSDDSGNEEFEPYMFLAEHPYNFIAEDYESLRQLLKVSECAEIDNILIKIGLSSEAAIQKLVEGVPIEKNAFLNKLSEYIKLSYFAPISSKEISSLCDSIARQMLKLIRRFTNILSILIPLFVHPKSSAVGFCLGLCFFTLYRYGIKKIETIYKIFSRLIINFLYKHNNNPFSIVYTGTGQLLNFRVRRIFRQDMWEIQHPNYTEKYELTPLYLHGLLQQYAVKLSIALFSSSSLLTFRCVNLGGIVQGFLLAEELLLSSAEMY